MGDRGNRNGLRRRIMILELGDPTFKTHFRMSKIVFERLVQAVGQQMMEDDGIKRLRTSVAESVLMGLWILFNMDTFRSESLNTGTSPSTIHRHYLRLISALVDIGYRYIKWPTARQRQETAHFYWRKFGFPGAVLSIDGTLIKITAPSEQKQRYVDRHHNYSMNVQLVSDHKRLIRDAYVGQPGSVNDGRVFKRSDLSHYLYSRNDMLSDDEHIVGDCAYVNTTKVLTPYKDFGNLTQSHRNFNKGLSQCRSTVERLNALLKARLARLKELYCKDIIRVNYHIGASLVLCNFIKLEGEEMEGIILGGDVPNINVGAAMAALDGEGRAKRRHIRLLLEEAGGGHEDVDGL